MSSSSTGGRFTAALWQTLCEPSKHSGRREVGLSELGENVSLSYNAAPGSGSNIIVAAEGVRLGGSTINVWLKARDPVVIASTPGGKDQLRAVKDGKYLPAPLRIPGGRSFQVSFNDQLVCHMCRDRLGSVSFTDADGRELGRASLLSFWVSVERDLQPVQLASVLACAAVGLPAHSLLSAVLLQHIDSFFPFPPVTWSG